MDSNEQSSALLAEAINDLDTMSNDELGTETVSTGDLPTINAKDLADNILIARYEYIAALQYASGLMKSAKNGKRLSSRNIQRALFAAIDHGITDSTVKFTTDDEARLAGVLAKILDLRTLLQADKINQLKEKENEIKTTNESN